MFVVGDLSDSVPDQGKLPHSLSLTLIDERYLSILKAGDWSRILRANLRQGIRIMAKSYIVGRPIEGELL